MTLLVATALPFEASAFAARLEGSRSELGRGWIKTGTMAQLPVALAVTGPGPRRVERAANALSKPPKVLISAGVAGGLRDDWIAGEVVLADTICTLGASVYATDETLRRRAERALAEGGVSWRGGRCLGVDQVLLSLASKRAAAERSGAGIVQMEDQIWAARAARWDIPFLSLRVVLDAVDHALPEAATQFSWRGPTLLETVRILAPRPRQLPALLKLSRAQRLARRALAAALECIVAALASDASGATRSGEPVDAVIAAGGSNAVARDPG